VRVSFKYGSLLLRKARTTRSVRVTDRIPELLTERVIAEWSGRAFHHGIGRRTGRLKSRLQEHEVGLRRLKDLLNGWVQESAQADFVPH
jgi:hypothetical protein